MNKKILIAEDSPVLSNLIKKILSTQNFESNTVRNGKELLEELDKKQYDIVLLDINMPLMSGEECIKVIRSNPKKEMNSLPVFAISGNAKNYTKKDFDNMGFNEFFTKPLNYDKIIEAILKYIK